jgi:tetratricopeptide (TPR) repeat protein
MNLIKQIFSLGEDHDYKQGIEHFNAHRYRQAIEAFQTVLQKKALKKGLYHNLSKFYAAQAYRNLGTVAFAAGKFGEALEKFEKALEFNSEHVDLNYYIGICFNNLGDFEHAQKAFQNSLAVDPDHLPTRMKLAVVFYNLKLWENAAAMYRSILIQKPKYADIHYRLGLAYLGTNKTDDALAAFEAAININPQYTDALIKAGLTHAQKGNASSALLHLNQVIARSPNFADVHYLIGLVHEAEQNFENAAHSFERAIEINPLYKNAKVKLAILNAKLARYQEALDLFQSAAEESSDDVGLKLAVDIIWKRLHKPPQDTSEIQKVLDEIFGDTGSISETLKSSCCQIDISPHFTEMISLLNAEEDSRETQHITQMLVPLYEDYVKNHPTYPDLRHGLGILYLKLKKDDAAEKSFQEAVRLNPNYLKARIDLLKILTRNGKFDEAMIHGEFVLSKGIQYPDVYLAIGESQFALKHYNEAQESADKALKIKPSFASAYYLMGKVFQAQGLTNDALIAFGQCLTMDAPSELKQDAKKALEALSPAAD